MAPLAAFGVVCTVHSVPSRSTARSSRVSPASIGVPPPSCGHAGTADPFHPGTWMSCAVRVGVPVGEPTVQRVRWPNWPWRALAAIRWAAPVERFCAGTRLESRTPVPGFVSIAGGAPNSNVATGPPASSPAFGSTQSLT